MSTPFRWDISKREQLGSLCDGPAAPAYKGFREDLRRCCARVVALCDDSDLIFVGRSPESLFDLMSGLFEGTHWSDRCSLLNVSTYRMPYRAVLRQYPAQLRSLANQFTELGLDPESIIRRPRPVALVDLVYMGVTLGCLVEFLMHWAAATRSDPRAVREKLRIVGITESEKPSPNTWRWQQRVHWAQPFRPRAIRNVAIPWRLWGFLGNTQWKVTNSNPPDHWPRHDNAPPPRDRRRLEALRRAVLLYDRGCTAIEREKFVAELTSTDRMRERWMRSLISALRGTASSPRSRG